MYLTLLNIIVLHHPHLHHLLHLHLHRLLLIQLPQQGLADAHQVNIGMVQSAFIATYLNISTIIQINVKAVLLALIMTQVKKCAQPAKIINTLISLDTFVFQLTVILEVTGMARNVSHALYQTFGILLLNNVLHALLNITMMWLLTIV